LVSGGGQVLTYTTNSASSVYLPIQADTGFSQGNWFPDALGNAQASYRWDGVDFNGGALPRDSNVADGGLGEDETPITMHMTIQAGATGSMALVPFGGEPEAVSLPGVAYGVVATNKPNALLTVDSVGLEQGIGTATQINTTSLVSTATASQLEGAGNSYPAWTQQYTQLPSDGSSGVAIITGLAEAWTEGANNAYDQAIDIQNQLRNPKFFAYTLSPPKTPKGVWPVVYFLTTGHKGYCQYFASAMGSMLRALGIPTRLMSGYGPGSNEQTGQKGARSANTSTTMTVSSSDAHSWVEAYFPNYGWISFEPTPASTQGNYQPIVRGSPAPLATTAPKATNPSKPSTKPGFLAPPPVGPGVAPGAPGLPMVVTVFLVGAAGVSMLAAVLLAWLALPRSVAGAWRRVELVGTLRGRQRHKAETYLGYGERLSAAWPGARGGLAVVASAAAKAEFSAAGIYPFEEQAALLGWHSVLWVVLRREGRRTGREFGDAI
jgi:transglutaminase-like putative cysteine protease